MSAPVSEAVALKVIAYVSRATAPVDSNELAALEDEARRYNRTTGITGLLVFDAGHYIQVLEGPAGAVDATLVRIRADPRHEDLEQVLDEPIDERRFARWALASIDLRAPAASVDIDLLAGGLADFLHRVDTAQQGKGRVLVRAFQQVLALLDKARGADDDRRRPAGKRLGDEHDSR
jgi:hypothetical protein